MAQRIRFRKSNRVKQTAPGQDYRNFVRDCSQLLGQDVERLGDAEQVGDSTARRFSCGAPGNLFKSRRVGVRGDDETRRVGQRPMIRTAAVSASQIEANAPLVGRYFGSDLSAASDGDSSGGYNAHNL